MCHSYSPIGHESLFSCSITSSFKDTDVLLLDKVESWTVGSAIGAEILVDDSIEFIDGDDAGCEVGAGAVMAQ